MSDLTSTPRPLPPSLSVVVPCYNEEDVIAELERRLTTTVSALSIPYEIILVNDGSKDKTWGMLQQIAQHDKHYKVVSLSRNFGHQLALTCGLDQAKGEVVFIIDADLQDPPELFASMLSKWQEGFDIVYGKRKKRTGESFSKKLFAFMFYRIFRKLTGFELPSDTGDFRLMDRKALEALRSLKERHRFIR